MELMSREMTSRVMNKSFYSVITIISTLWKPTECQVVLRLPTWR